MQLKMKLGLYYVLSILRYGSECLAYNGNKSERTLNLPHKMPSKHNTNILATKGFQQRTDDIIIAQININDFLITVGQRWVMYILRKDDDNITKKPCVVREEIGIKRHPRMKVAGSRLRWTGHVQRMSEERLTKRTGRSRKGRS